MLSLIAFGASTRVVMRLQQLPSLSLLCSSVIIITIVECIIVVKYGMCSHCAMYHSSTMIRFAASGQSQQAPAWQLMNVLLVLLARTSPLLKIIMFRPAS